MPPRYSRFSILWGCLAVLLSPALRAGTISFDQLDEYSETFQSVGADAPTWNAQAGQGGSGGLIAGSTGYLAAVKNSEPLQIKPGQSVTVAMNFLYKSQATRIAQRNAGVFLTANAEISPLETPEGSLIAVFLHNVSNHPGQEQTVVSYALGGKIELADKGQPYVGSDWWDSTALQGHWCQVRVKFTKLPTAGLWELDIKVLDLGEDGTAEPAELFAINEPEVSAEALYSAPEIFAGFQNHRHDRGFRSMDDFEITVE